MKHFQRRRQKERKGKRLELRNHNSSKEMIIRYISPPSVSFVDTRKLSGGLWPPDKGGMYPMGVRAALPLTLEYTMMISTRNRDEKNGPPFVNSLGLRGP